MSREEAGNSSLTHQTAVAARWPELEKLVRARTPARLFMGRAGAAYTTATQLQLRADHASARDAVEQEFDLERNLGRQLVRERGLFQVQTQAGSKIEYLMRPDLGRRLNEDARQAIAQRCPPNSELQVIIGDGLSVAAVARQALVLLPLLLEGAARRGWNAGQVFAVRYCRVGVLNDIGKALSPTVAVLLIGERPGLATAESLSAYMAFRPRTSHTDADRNLISNIHARGVPAAAAAARILNLAAQMVQAGFSGAALKEGLTVEEIE